MPKKKVFGLILTSIVLLYFIIICFGFGKTNTHLLSWLGIIIYFYCIYSWCTVKNESLFCPYVIFITFFMLFNYGQCIMWAFGIHSPSEIGSGELYYGSGIYPTQEDIANAQWFTCLCLLAFHIGALLVRHKSAKLDMDVKPDKIENDDSIKRVMFLVGCILSCIVVPVAIYIRIKELGIARQFGYKALYYGDYSTQSGYLQILMFLFFPSLICLLIGGDYSKRIKNIAYSIFGIYALLTLLTGDRGGWLYSLVVLMWINYYNHKWKFSKFLLYIVLGIVGINILSIITAIRDTSLVNVDLGTVFKSTGFSSSAVKGAFFEMGGSMGIVTYFQIVGRDIFPYLNTYLTAILGIVSSRLLRFFGIKQVLIGDWFSQEHLRISWGAGFSMVGEAFVNGGYIGGIFYMFLWGLIIGRILQIVGDRPKSPLKMFITVCVLNIILRFPRGASYLILKELFYGVFIIVVLIVILNNLLNKKQHTNRYDQLYKTK